MNSGIKKIHFIHPSAYDELGQIIKNKRNVFPSRALPYLAALTPRHYETRITDENVEPLDFSDDADLIALTGTINRIPRAIDIAREYRKIGKKVVIGGIGAYSVQDEIERLDVFDSIVIGDAENSWNVLLDDFERGDLKRVYQNQPPRELKGLPFARFDLLKPEKYRKAPTDPNHLVIPIETSRGCPHGCIYCSVSPFFGKTMRYRPIPDIIDEIKYQKAKYFFFTDDNIAINPDRARELFSSLKPLEIHWMGQFETSVINTPDVVKLAAESGCRMAILGVESLSKDNIISIQKKRNLNIPINELIQCLKKAGIRPICSVMFGLDHDTPESMMETSQYMIDNKVGLMLPWILTPFPRTPLYEKFKNDNLILHDNYSLYDGVHCVFKPKQFEPYELEETYWRTYRHYYMLKSVFSRVFITTDFMRLARLFLSELFMRNNVYHRRHPYSN
ncbi:MAG: radical SAM protein [Dehalococcoidia bacterium]|jgi:radical SAM superfamily enzyme YgiQ (UPF0313 family)